VPAAIAPPPGLVGGWPGDGSAADLAGSSNGTLLGGATFAPGTVGQALPILTGGVSGQGDFFYITDTASPPVELGLGGGAAIEVINVSARIAPGPDFGVAVTSAGSLLTFNPLTGVSWDHLRIGGQSREHARTVSREDQGKVHATSHCSATP